MLDGALSLSQLEARLGSLPAGTILFFYCA